MKRILIIALVTVVGGFAATHYLIASKIKEQLDQAAGGLSPFGTLSYGQVWVSPLGEASVNNIVFYPHGTSDDFRVDRLAIHADDLQSLYQLGRNVSGGKAPDSLKVTLEGIQVDLGATLLEPLWEGMEDSSQPAQFFASGCGERSYFSFADLDTMGYRSTVSDMDLSYRFSPDKSQLNVSGDMTTRDMYGFQYSIDLDIDPQNLGNPMAMLMSTSLRHAGLTLEDYGYTNRVMDFCAHETEMDRVAYRQHHMKAWQENWRQMYVEPGGAMIEAYEAFLQQPGTVRVQTYTSMSMMEMMQNPSPEALLDKLGLQIRVNNEAPKPLRVSFSMREWNERKQASQRGVPAASSETETAAKAEPETAPKTSTRQPTQISLARLDQYLNQPVVIKLKDGRLFEGEILEITDLDTPKLRFKQTVHNGTMIMPLELGQVDKVYQR